LRRGWEQKEAAKKAKAAEAPARRPAVKKDKVQSGLAKGAVRAAQEGLPVYSISADLEGSTGMSFFQKSFPDRFVEVGVAEANMISTGAGFSKAGFIPIVDTFGQFGVTKGNLPLTMSALSQAPVIAVFSHVGFQDAADGASHEATTYFAATSAIPHTVVIACSCADEAEALMYEAIKRVAKARLEGQDGESVIFFVGRENYPVRLLDNPKYEWGKAQVLAEGSDVVIAACGPLVGRAIDAGRQLKEKGVAATVISNPFINQVDVETIGARSRNVPAASSPSKTIRSLRDGRAVVARPGAGGHRPSHEIPGHKRGIRPIGLGGGAPLRKTRPDRGRNCGGGARIAQRT
jgi:transketolase